MLLSLLILYIFLLILLSIYRSRNTEKQNARNFLTAGTTVGALFCSLSLVSTVIGGSATLGMGSLAQKIGTAAFWWLGVGVIGLVLHGLFIAPAIRATGACTLPDVLGRLVGENAKRWSAFIIVISWVGVVAAQLTALRMLLTDILPPVQGEVIYLLLALAIILHTAFGGQKAVIRTDALQTVILTGAFIFAALWCILNRGDSISNIDPIPFNESFTFWDWLKLCLLVGITYVVGPDIFSRTFSAKTTRSASLGAWMAAGLLFLFSVIITLLVMSNLSASNPLSGWLSDASPMPTLIKVALALGAVSALTGTADTVLLSAAGIVEKDLLGGDQSSRLRKLVALFGLGAWVLTYQSGDIIGWLLYAYALFVPGVAAPLFILLVRKGSHVNSKLWLGGAVIGGILGLIANLTGWPLSVVGIAISTMCAWISVEQRHCQNCVVQEKKF